VTYGAGGSSIHNRTTELSALVKDTYHIASLAHLTCINSTREAVKEQLLELQSKGIMNILALRGDRNPDLLAPGDFKYAANLIAFIKSVGDFDIAAACYPEGHVESENLAEDIRHLKAKVDAGAGSLVTQMFFENDCFYRFQELCTVAGIDVPVEAGIMPVVNKGQIERMVSLSGASLPSKFTRMLARYESNKDALRDAGIAYACDQIVDLIASGVRGIHIYTMNSPYIAKRIYSNIRSIVESTNEEN
jgi:methylenetetrahydrofolate reductase (NADPH)